MDTEPKKLKQPEEKSDAKRAQVFNPNLIGAIADEVSKTLLLRLPQMVSRPRKKSPTKKARKIENALFLDTSAIIDGRIFDLIDLGLLNGVAVIPSSILLELKHIADSQDMVRRERGQRGLADLEKMKKSKKLKMIVLPEDEIKIHKGAVDEQLIKVTKLHRGKLITCDYNLEKKASIESVVAINMNALANALKVIAVPGESLHINVSHQGKDPTQGVGYLDDGTMIVVEEGKSDIGYAIDVVVSRVIQTASGRILFAKKI